MRWRDVLLLLLLALIFTGLASIKPIHIDEAANYYYARQIAAHPCDPYGFEMFWYQTPQPANEVLTPPVLVYWWGLGISWLGHHPVLWKVWLLPFVLVFVFSLHALLRRFALGTEMPLTWMTALSPAFLPSLNLMPDIPALAWSLSAVAVFLRIGPRALYSPVGPESVESDTCYHPFAWAALAGLLAGIGMQTKYTAFVTPGVLLLWAVLIRRPGLGIVAGVVAASIFLGWETLIAWKYGNSHFWLQAQASRGQWSSKGFLFLPLLPILGGVASGVGWLALIALGARRGTVAAGVAATLLILPLLADVGASWSMDVDWPTWLGGDGQTYEAQFTLATLLFGFLGLGLVGVCAWLARRSWGPTLDQRFLVCWLGLEVAGYFALTPFPAVRRVLAVVLVLTIIAGRLARPLGGKALWGVAAGNIALGLLFFAVDVCDARAQLLAAQEAARRIAETNGGRTWYAGHWGFQYYAEAAGMKPLVPDESILQPGDWLVLPGPPIDRPIFELPSDRSDTVFDVRVTDWLPWKTVVGYYGGTDPLDHCAQPRLVVAVHRVRAPWRVLSGE